MSSQIIYNTKDYIDQHSLEVLASMCSLSNKLLSFDDQNQANQTLPSIIWAIRNFTLLHNFPKDNDYFEDVLTIKQNDSSNQIENKKIISKWFDQQRRHCICLPVPASDSSGRPMEEILSNLSAINPSVLRPKFNIQMNELIKLSRSIVKPSNSRNGVVFMDFLEYLVGLINNEEIISLEDLTKTALELKVKKFEDRLVSEIKNNLTEDEGLNEDKLKKVISDACLSVKKIYGIQGSECDKIIEELNEAFHQKNDNYIRKQNEKFLIEQWNGIKKRLISDENKIKSSKELKEAFDEVEKNNERLCIGEKN